MLGLPIVPLRHQWLKILPPSGANPLQMPTIRDWRHGVYIRPLSDRILVGGFEKKLPLFSKEVLANYLNHPYVNLPLELGPPLKVCMQYSPTHSNYQGAPFDHFGHCMEAARWRIGFETVVEELSGAESFTPDAHSYIGKHSATGLWVLAGIF